MPETIQIYVCADNCMRGVVLTAAEMNAADRFSYVIIEEDNLLNGNLEDITIEGVTDVLKKLNENPKQYYSLQYVSIIFSDVILTAGIRRTGKPFPGNYICTLFYGPDHAETWADTGSETAKSNI